MKKISSVRDLEVYQLGFDAAMELFNLSKNFLADEKYSLVDQIRRSSRSVCSNLSEGWRKRRYKAVFLNKLSDAAQEAAETQTWLELALKCGYVKREDFVRIDEHCERICHAIINGTESGFLLQTIEFRMLCSDGQSFVRPSS